MATDMDEFYPFATGLGANVSEEEWRDMAEDWLPTGVMAGEDSELAVVQHTPSAAASIDVSTGEVRIAGHVGIISATKTLGIAANASGNPRIDLIVARAVFTAGSKKIELDVLQGTAAAAPVEPALTQNLTSMWEEPLAAIDVAAGFATIVTANIRDRRFLTRTVRQLAAKEPVRVSTTAALAASTVTGTKRVANANGALGAIDGVTLVAGDRLLDKDHATTAQRGIWRLVDPGSATRPWILERPRDFDTSSDVRAALWVRVAEGTANADTGWLLTTNDPIILGTTGLVFAQFPAPSGAGKIVQIVTATSATDDTRTATSFADTSLAATITPLFADSILHVEANFPVRVDATASTVERRIELQLFNTTDAAALSGASLREVGRRLAAASGAGAITDTTAHLFGTYTVNSLAARTIKVRFKAAAADTTVSLLCNTIGQGIIRIMEVRP